MSNSTTFRHVSRQLVVAWCAWLLLSWAVNLAVDPQLVADLLWKGHIAEFAERMSPAVRGMLVSVMIGLGLMWPAIRLSQPPIGAAGLVQDWMGLMLVCQIVVWPMRVMVEWSLERTLVVDLQIAVWAAAIGVAIWFGTRHGTNPTTRFLAMAVCVLMLLGWFPLAAVTGNLNIAMWSPYYALWTLARDTDPQQLTDALMRTLAVAIAVAGVVYHNRHA